MNNILNKISIAAGLLAMLSSCSFLEVEPQIVRTENFYKTASEVRNGLAGVYGVLNNEAFYGNYYSIMYSNIDDLSYFNRDVSTNFLQHNRHDAGTSQIYDMWVEIYQGIKNANTFLETISAPQMKEKFDQDGRYFNEARFLRAYYHFILAQAWGDVPKIDKAYKSQDENLSCAATPQEEVLRWVVSEMEACLEDDGVAESLENAPSRIVRTTVQGILARVCLFTAGESVDLPDDIKETYMQKAMTYADAVITSGKHGLNPDYSQVFKNMIMDVYDTPATAHEGKTESMWEVDFLGDRSSADKWSNGRIGDLLGLQSSGDSGYEEFNCNFAYGQYNGSLKLWDLYWKTDLVEQESEQKAVPDKRLAWNLPPYNYAGKEKIELKKNTVEFKTAVAASVQKTPYVYNGTLSFAEGLGMTEEQKGLFYDPLAAQAVRNCGKFRREVEYEGLKNAKMLYTSINYPLLRYSDVLLMYAEAANELGGPSQTAYDCVKAVRDRAGVQTRPLADYDKDSFRQLVRNERGRELCFESLRKFDLIRWGEYVEAMNAYRDYAQDERWSKDRATSERAATMGLSVTRKHIYLPIPSIELGVNGLLVQNPLW